MKNQVFVGAAIDPTRFPKPSFRPFLIFCNFVPHLEGDCIFGFYQSHLEVAPKHGDGNLVVFSDNRYETKQAAVHYAITELRRHIPRPPIREIGKHGDLRMLINIKGFPQPIFIYPHLIFHKNQYMPEVNYIGENCASVYDSLQNAKELLVDWNKQEKVLTASEYKLFKTPEELFEYVVPLLNEHLQFWESPDENIDYSQDFIELPI